VQIAGNESKTMGELSLGDMVHVGNGVFSEVFLFTHQLSEVRAQFVQLTTATAQLALTPGHFLYVNGQLKQARSVKVGDAVTLGDGATDAVLSTSFTWAAGLYNPHTKAGDIVVNGIKASCYTEAVHPTLAHALLLPVRALYEAGVTFGEAFKAGKDSPLLNAIVPGWVADAIRA
jgi:hypothetical protein